MLTLRRGFGRREACAGHRRAAAGNGRRVVVLASKQDETDLVTRWVGKLFGKAAVEDPTPFGLKRMDWSQVKDLEVTVGRWAELLPSDVNGLPEFQMVRPLLAGTQLEDQPLRLAYDADKDGWTHMAFHEKVDGYGAAVVLARTSGGAVLGGYNPLGFDGYGEKATMGAFLFGWPDGDTSKRPFKLPKVVTDQLAVVDRLDAGPQFGPGDLKLLLRRGAEKVAYCKLTDYQRPGTLRTLFNPAGGDSTSKAELAELKVLVRRGGKVKYELDGLRWKSSLTNSEEEGGEGPPPGMFTM